MLKVNLTGNVSVQVIHVFSFSSPKICLFTFVFWFTNCSFWLRLLFIYSFVPSFVSIGVYSRYLRQQRVSSLSLPWSSAGPCTATGPTLSPEPEAAFGRILVTGGKRPFLCNSQPPVFIDTLRQRLRPHVFLLINLRLEEAMFSFQRNTPKLWIFQELLAWKPAAVVAQLMHSTCFPHMASVYYAPWLPLHLTSWSPSGFCEVFSSSWWRLQGSVLCLLSSNGTCSFSVLIQSHAF